jgi:flagella basal body P-ring formation protein FlgA
MNNAGHFLRGILFAMITTASLAASAGETPLSGLRTLTQKETVATASPAVCFSDVFEEFWVDSRCPRDQEGCCPWKVDPATRRITLTRADAARAAVAAKLLNDGSAVKGAVESAVTQTHRALTAEEVATRARVKLQTQDADGEWTVQSARVLGAVVVPFDAKWDVALPTTLMKLSSAKIIYDNGAGEALAGWAQVNVSHWRTALVAKRDLPSGTALKTEDFRTQKVDVLSAGADAMGPVSLATLDGDAPLRTRMSLRAGGMLTTGVVEKAPSVVMGDAVTLVLRSENLKIMTKGIAQGSGAVGDTVSVQLRSYNRTFRGKVAEGKQVEVWL